MNRYGKIIITFFLSILMITGILGERASAGVIPEWIGEDFQSDSNCIIEDFVPAGTIPIRFVDDNWNAYTGNLGQFGLYDPNGKLLATISGSGRNPEVKIVDNSVSYETGALKYSCNDLGNAFDNFLTSIDGICYYEVEDLKQANSVRVYNTKKDLYETFPNTCYLEQNKEYKVTRYSVTSMLSDEKILTVPAGSVRLKINSKYADGNTKKFKLSSCGFSVNGKPKTSVTVSGAVDQTFSLPSGEIDLCIDSTGKNYTYTTFGFGGTGASVYKKKTYYVKKTCDLSELLPDFFDEDWKRTEDGVKYNFLKDYTDSKGRTCCTRIFIRSGAFYQAVIPDSDGNVSFYVCVEHPETYVHFEMYYCGNGSEELTTTEKDADIEAYLLSESRIVKTAEIDKNYMTFQGLTITGDCYQLIQMEDGAIEPRYEAYVTNSSLQKQPQYKEVQLTLNSPVISSVKNQSGSVQVSWNKVNGADGYYVYRKDTRNGTWHYIGGTQKNLTFTDTNVENGTVYYYAVKSFAGTGNQKTVSASSAAKNTIYLKNVFISSIANAHAGTMTVVHSKNDKATGYQIAYSTNSNMSNSKYVTKAGGNWETIQATGLTKGKTYYVMVRPYITVAGYTFYGNWSAKKSITITK